MDRQTYAIAQAKRIFKDDGIEARLEAEPETFIASMTRVETGGRGSRHAESPVETELPAERLRVLQDGRRALTKIRRAGRDRPGLTPAETIGLEAIILLEGRPAIRIQNGRFDPPPAQWSHLEDQRSSIEAAIARVGRIEVQGHPRLAWVGTGFLVAPDVIMTNRHVAVHFAEKGAGSGWQFIGGRQARIDLREERDEDLPAEYALNEVLHVDARVDMALVRVERQSAAGGDLPGPLTLQQRAPRRLRGREVYVIGFPAWDGRRNDPDEMQRIFSDVYNVKRLQPGTVRNWLVLGREFKHDCSTLGGNSGSCVVDLESGKVLGLHFAGRYAKANEAVALWKLRRRRPLQRAGVKFG